MNKSWLFWLGLLALDLISFLSYTVGLSNWAAAIAIIAVAVVAWRNYTWALIILVIELIVGSQGYWFKLEFGETSIPVRLAIFIIVLSVFLYREIERRDFKWLGDQLVSWWLAAVVALIWSAAIGWWRNDFANWFLDFNGYLYMFVFLPLYRYRNDWMLKFKSIASAAVLYLAFKTIMLFYLYSHFSALALEPIYHWIRNSGWGEITYVSQNIFRIFSQSHIYLLIGGIIYASTSLFSLSKRPLIIRYRFTSILSALFIIGALLISLSRSFWLGGTAALLFSLILTLFLYPSQLKDKFVNIGATLILILAASGFLFTISRFPMPPPLGEGGNFLLDRASVGSGEAAGASRLQLLGPLWDRVSDNWLVGAGFGATVTYRTLDPRLVSATAGGLGLYTTYAFEWGYLDMWLKLGLVGLLLYVGWWGRVGLLAVKTLKYNRQTAIMLSAAIAIVAANMTTPYLNHPLGIGGLSVLCLFIYNDWEISGK